MQQKNKTLIALAIASAFALPLAAQAQTNLSISGKIYPQIVNASLSGATATGQTVSTLAANPTGAADVSQLAMDSPNSRLSFRGTEDLGGGMKAFFQLEIGFGVDTGANTSSSNLFSRDSFVGIGGGFGTVKLGSMDTVYKKVGDTLSFLGISSGNFVSISNVLSKPAVGTSSASSFHLRRGNSVVYESPTLNGFQGRLQYSLGEVAGSTSANSVISSGVTYNKGPVYVALAYETHKNLFGMSRNIASSLANHTTAGASSNDTGLRLTGQYKFTKNTRAEVNIASIKYDETGGATGKFSSYKRDVWSIAADHKIGAYTLVASYAQGGAGSCARVGGTVCSTDGLEGKMFNLGVGYNLSKRTMLYAMGSMLENGKSAVYNNFNNGRATTGQDINTVAAGISHTF